MCKAKNTISQILQLCEEAEQYFKEKSNRLSILDGMQQDILHMLEDDRFNAAEGYKYAKKLQEIRQERRIIKQEVETMLVFKPYMGNVISQAKKSQEKVTELDNKLTYLHKNKIYNPRVLKDIV